MAHEKLIELFNYLELFFHKLANINILESMHMNYKFKSELCPDDEEQFYLLVKSLIEDLQGCVYNKVSDISGLSADELKVLSIQEDRNEINNKFHVFLQSDDSNKIDNSGYPQTENSHRNVNCFDQNAENPTSEGCQQATVSADLDNFICEQSDNTTNKENSNCVKIEGNPIFEQHKNTEEIDNFSKKKHFCCYFCNRHYTTKSKLSSHLTKCSKSVKVPERKLSIIPFYCCENCFGVSLSIENFQKHMCSETSEVSNLENYGNKKIISDIEELYRLNKFICLVCTEEYRSVDRMNYHLPKCKPPPFLCEICQEELFFTKRELNAHKKKKHKGQDCYFCEECNLKFKLRTSLRKHQINRHETNQGPFECDVENCAAVFSKRIHLTNHKISEHNLEKGYLCQICGNKFCNKSSLAVHVQTHEPQKKFMCQFCSKSFVQKEKLKYHERTHTGERPHVCKICGKSFIKKTKLNEHIKRHSGEKTFSCSHCSNAYSSKCDLKKHINKKHEKVEMSSDGIK